MPNRGRGAKVEKKNTVLRVPKLRLITSETVRSRPKLTGKSTEHSFNGWNGPEGGVVFAVD
jgi:hypothetical protein